MAAEGIAEVTTTTATSVVTLAVVTPATATTETAETSGLMTGITIYGHHVLKVPGKIEYVFT